MPVGHSGRVTQRGRIVVAVAAVLVWFGALTLGLGAIAVLELDAGLLCERAGSDANYGQVEWSLLPPGPRCRWTEEINGVDAVEEPGPLTSIWLAALVGLGLPVVWAIRRVARGAAAEREAGAAALRAR